MSLSNRGNQWEEFSDKVLMHIEDYTVMQYGDSPDDQVEDWTAEQCIESIQRYINRFHRNARGPDERLRDMKKVAHYACLVYDKLIIERIKT
jgi:hypothetical protein